MRLIVKVNDDVDILNYLADLEDRTPIITLDKFLSEDRKKRYFIIDKHKKEGVITILLCNAPFFDVNENGNILMLFVHDDLNVVEGYFKRLMGATEYKDRDKRIAVRQVLNIIHYYIQNKEEFEKPQISNAGK